METPKILRERAAWYRAWAQLSRDGEREVGMYLAYYAELIADIRDETEAQDLGSRPTGVSPDESDRP
jgi:hypothetical protein